MGRSAIASRTLGHYEHEAIQISAFIALDGSSNVVGTMPTGPGAAVATTPYTLAKGLSKAIGLAGAIVTQPHTTTGTYVFTLDDSWVALLNADVQLIDSGAVATIDAFIDANVTSGTSASIGSNPGNNPALAAQTVRVRFRSSAGALADPAASTGFWLQLLLKPTTVP